MQTSRRSGQPAEPHCKAQCHFQVFNLHTHTYTGFGLALGLRLGLEVAVSLTLALYMQRSSFLTVQLCITVFEPR